MLSTLWSFILSLPRPRITGVYQEDQLKKYWFWLTVSEVCANYLYHSLFYDEVVCHSRMVLGKRTVHTMSDRRQRQPSRGQGMSILISFSNVLSPNRPFSNGFVPWWSKCSHDPVTSQLLPAGDQAFNTQAFSGTTSYLNHSMQHYHIFRFWGNRSNNLVE